jgi:hypothetical protein
MESLWLGLIFAPHKDTAQRRCKDGQKTCTRGVVLSVCSTTSIKTTNTAATPKTIRRSRRRHRRRDDENEGEAEKDKRDEHGDYSEGDAPSGEQALTGLITIPSTWFVHAHAQSETSKIAGSSSAFIT